MGINWKICCSSYNSISKIKGYYRVNIHNVKEWADESYALSKSIVYDGININSISTEEYFERRKMQQTNNLQL